MLRAAVHAVRERADSPSLSSTASLRRDGLIRGSLWTLLILYAASTIRSLVQLLPAYTINRYVAPWYYVDYSAGFVRRGLPGELLRHAGGPSRLSVEIVGWGLTFFGAFALLFIFLRVAWLATRPMRLAAVTLLVLAPLGLTTIIRDPGRYDVIAMLAMAAMLLAITTRASLVPAGVVAAVSTAISVASEDFTIAYLAPIVVALLYVTTRSEQPAGRDELLHRLRKPLAFTLLPSVGLVLASLALPPSSAYVDDLVRRAHPPTNYNADWELRRSLPTIVRWTWAHRGALNMVVTALIWLSIYLVTLAGVRILLGRLGRWYWLSAAYFAAVATVMSFTATDYRRWWTLALVGHLTVVAVLSAGRSRATFREASGWIRRYGTIAVAAALLVAVYAQSLPNTVRPPEDGWRGLSKYVGPGYPSGLVPFWIKGDEAP